MSYDGPNRRRWWMRPWRILRGAAMEFGHEPEGRWHHLWRDFVPLLAILLAALAVFGNEDKVDQGAVDAATAKAEARTAKRIASSQQQGRGAAVAIICGALVGVEDAGRLVLTDRLPGTKRLRQPSTSQRDRVRRIYARAYNRVISKRIRDEAGVQGARVIKADGSVDCDELRVAARTP